jgi:hypothetical protein
MVEPPKEFADDELAKYDSSVQQRIKHFTKGYHEERRAKEAAMREREEALRIAQTIVEENKKLKGSLGQNQAAVLDSYKRLAANDLEKAKAKYKEAYESGDSDAMTEAQANLTTAAMRAERVNNINSPALQPEKIDVQTQQEEKGEFVAVGWRGGLVNTEDQWRSVDDKGPGEVDVLFSYFMAFNREAMIEVGGFNPRALYYRNADMEYSLKIRQAGGRLLQMELPLIQDRHHGYHDADPEYREVQSKKNYDRILDKYRGKDAILSPRR